MKPKLIDRSAFGEIWKLPPVAGIAGDIYHVVPSEGRIIKFMNDRGTLCTMKDTYVSVLQSARKLIGKDQVGKLAQAGEIKIPAAHVISNIKGETAAKNAK